jgi:hypothetical protein
MPDVPLLLLLPQDPLDAVEDHRSTSPSVNTTLTAPLRPSPSHHLSGELPASLPCLAASPFYGDALPVHLVTREAAGEPHQPRHHTAAVHGDHAVHTVLRAQERGPIVGRIGI